MNDGIWSSEGLLPPRRGQVTNAMAWALAIMAMGLAGGCWRASQSEVVVYTALDEEFSQPIFQQFTEKTGIRVLAKYDTESTKTVGLANAILEESERPRCDLFWNNEILNTLRIERKGLLASHHPSTAHQFPATFRSAEGTWFGFAARARVLIVNTQLVVRDQWPDSILDLVDPRWEGRTGLAKPLFGTTATHAACLFAHWGEERAKDFFHQVHQRCQVLGGNKQVARAVASGRLMFGLTDTDDAIIEKEAGFPVQLIYPDQGRDQMGTLFIPNTLALVRGGPHEDNAQRLLEYLLSPDVEARLATGPSAQIPLNPSVQVPLRVQTPRTVKPLAVNFNEAADQWDTAASFLRDLFAS